MNPQAAAHLVGKTQDQLELDRLRAAEAAFRKTLEWIVANPGMHPANAHNQARTDLACHPKQEN